jgi:hypothetical protein
MLSQEERYQRISQLITLRDNLLEMERELAGRANYHGFRMHVPETVNAGAHKIAFAKACMSPKGILKYQLGKILEHWRKQNRTSAKHKRLLLAVEAMFFWADVAYQLATTVGLPYIKLAGVSTDLTLKATQLLSQSRAAAIQMSMDHFWSESQHFRRMHRTIIKEVDNEIHALE